ncbi:YqhA family protein [Sulfurihydrogenibium sp.]|uniref:YqhA family protein n=1 Tax=Sulfurihydrogenibium sp. TaxID=2053621 RepID=UPI00262AE410|nr:YqhA family protein [Sulfurihydrogenibium sp.]
MNKIEQIFERILWESRLMVVLAVIASIFASLTLVVMGTYDIILIFQELFHAFSDKEVYEQFHKDAITHIISAIDAYLIATVLLIFGIGLYELFVSKIDYAEKETKSSKILVVHSLDQLKDKLAKVIVMVLIVTFFKHAVKYSYEEVLNLLYLGIGIFLIAFAIFLLSKSHKESKEEH